LHKYSHFQPKCNFQPKNSTFFPQKRVFFKSHYQKMFGPLYSESAYFSDAKNTFEMFGMICFGVDSQTHTPVCKTYSTSCRLCRHHQLRAPAPLQLCPPSQAARQLVLCMLVSEVFRRHRDGQLCGRRQVQKVPTHDGRLRRSWRRRRRRRRRKRRRTPSARQSKRPGKVKLSKLFKKSCHNNASIFATMVLGRVLHFLQ
jgi:hypothetical protein